MRSLVCHSIGGGWGQDDEVLGSTRVMIIRGADFPSVREGDLTGAPVRWEQDRKIPQRMLRVGDILLEVSGGTTDRPTGRTIYISERLLSQTDLPVIPASFCRLVRIDPEKANPLYVFHWLQYMFDDGRTWKYQNRSTGIANFQFEYFLDTELVRLPSPKQQEAIAVFLDALDQETESCRSLRGALRSYGALLFESAISEPDSRQANLASVCTSIARGVAPKYCDGDLDSPLVLSQKCIRDGWVSTRPARRMFDRKVPVAKKASAGDILVNSTGVGTLGRVGRWHAGEVFVDSHVSVVKPDTSAVLLTVLGYAVAAKQANIEAMATGSTGQTELSPTRLGELIVKLPSESRCVVLEPALAALEDASHATFAESASIAALRDLLLPELMEGRVELRGEAS